MGLSNEQIKKLVENRPREKQIQRGIAHQRRLRFHSDTVLRKTDFFSAYHDFTNWVGNEAPELLPRDKFEKFVKLLRPPIPTIELTEAVFSQLEKIFYAQDSFFEYRFKNPELQNDWNDYRDQTFWRTHGFQAMQSAIDSVWVADLPDIQIGDRPEPYQYLVDINDIIDISNDSNLNCQYVIFRSGEYALAYDDEFIRVYTLRDGGERRLGFEISADPIQEVKHGLGYTPARQFWSETLEANNLVNRESPITKELTELDWLLFHQISKRHLDMANAYPITAVYEADDDYEDSDRTQNKDRSPGGKKTEGNRLVGAGTLIEVKPPREGEIDLMANPVKIIGPDVQALEWHVSEENRLLDKIYRSIVGVNQRILNDAAKNEKQIESSFESQLSVLMKVKKNFEIIHKFADYTIAKLRYGDQFIGCSIDYGTKFYLKDASELNEDYKQAKDAGASESILEQIQTEILNTKYREDMRGKTRAEVIRDIDPLPDKTVSESMDIFDKGGIDKINFIIKSNLINFVRRFERENINLADFAEQIDYNTKVQIIKDEFKKYADELNQGERRSDDQD